ncbi:TPA: hypothetical protein ACGW5B_002279 [Bacillus paranthracis]
MFSCSPEELRRLIEQRKNNPNGLEPISGEKVDLVIYRFEIIRFETFRVKSNQYNIVKFLFLLSNEHESFEEEQIFSYDDDMGFTKRYDEFLQQFANFVELKDDIEFEDFVGEKGTCHIINVYENLKVYRKIMINSLEVSENE